MTNEQAALKAEEKIESLKQDYMNSLGPLAIATNSNREQPSLEQLLECQRKGNSYFNYAENFVGSSGLLGAHANGKWVTGFAETCFSLLESYLLHIHFLRSHSDVLGSHLTDPDKHAFANMQRMVKEYLPTGEWKSLKSKFTKNNLPVSGFEKPAVSDMSKMPIWQLVTGLVIGVIFLTLITVLAILIPNPTPWQSLIFRGGFSISLAAIAAIIPGFITVDSRFQKLSVRAGGAIAIFLIVWFANPPALIGS